MSQRTGFCLVSTAVQVRRPRDSGPFSQPHVYSFPVWPGPVVPLPRTRRDNQGEGMSERAEEPEGRASPPTSFKGPAVATRLFLPFSALLSRFPIPIPSLPLPAPSPPVPPPSLCPSLSTYIPHPSHAFSRASSSMASSPGSPPPHLLFLLLLVATLSFAPPTAHANAVFRVRRKFAHRGATLADLRAHDSHRHGRLLATVDLPLGGTGSPTMDGLYYAELGIGSPSTTYHVQVDTGSDILWVNCYNCKNCPKKTNLGFDLKLYNPKLSNSANVVSCDSDFCSAAYGDKLQGCTSGTACQYSLLYGDGSGTDGVFVTDNIQLHLISGNMQTSQGNATVSFGCGAQSSGELGSSDAAVDGIFGFGQSNTSVLSQLSASGVVKKMFAHCLDTKNGGGGIFAIGNVVQPKVQSTPLVPNQPHYNVNMKGIDVAGKFLALPTDLFDTSEKTGTIIDSGTTLAYIPDVALKALMDQVFLNHQALPFRQIQGFVCFPYTGDTDEGFPYITLHFEGSVTLKVYPHDYLFEYESDIWCLGFQSSTSQSNDRNYFLLGDLVLANKLVFYDLENQTIGWTDYNCSSTIKVRDDKTGAVYSVGSHNISSSPVLEMGRVLLLFLLGSVLHHLFC